MTIVPALIGSFIVLAVIALGLWYFERMLAKRPSKYAGIGMPAAFLVLSLFSIVKSIPSVAETMQAQGYGVIAMIVTVILSFLVTNIPTLWVYFVYRRTRKKLGFEIWPFKK